MSIKISELLAGSPAALAKPTDASEITDTITGESKGILTSQNITLYAETFASRANNLSDLADAADARTNLGLGSLATQDLIVDADITTNTIQNDKLAPMPANTIKGNDTGFTANADDLTVSEVLTMLDLTIPDTEIAFGSPTNTITSSPKITWNNTTENLNVDGYGLFKQELRVSDVSAEASLKIGLDSQTSVTILARASSPGQFFGMALAGDTCLKQASGSNSILIGVSSDPEIKITENNLFLPSFSSFPGVLHSAATTGLVSTSLIVAADITDNTITALNQAQMPANTIKGNNTGGASDEINLSVAQVSTMLGIDVPDMQIAFGSVSNTITSSADFKFDDSINTLKLDNDAKISFGSFVSNKKLALYDGANEFQFYGFGVQPNAFKYSVAAISADHIFYAGTSPTTEAELGRIKGDGIFIPATGINLPTLGGTPSTLDFYEKDVTVTFVLSGPWAASRSFPVKFSRIGNQVIMQWGDLSAVIATSNNQITSGQGAGDVYIPARFIPANLVFNSISVYHAIASEIRPGVMTESVNGTGTFLIFAPADFSLFLIGNLVGIPAGNAKWTV